MDNFLNFENLNFEKYQDLLNLLDLANRKLLATQPKATPKSYAPTPLQFPPS